MKSFDPLLKCAVRDFKTTMKSQPTTCTVKLKDYWGFSSTLFYSPVPHLHTIYLSYYNNSLKSPYHGFLKINVHMVWNIALREWKHPAKIYIWKCTVY